MANEKKLSKEDLAELERLKTQPWFESGKSPRSYLFHERNFFEELEGEWGRWGAEGIGKLRKVMLSKPTENEMRAVYEKEPEYYQLRRLVLPDLEKWQMQFDAYAKALKDQGVEVHYLEPPIPAMGPYGYVKWFVTPSEVLITKGGAIVPRYGIAGWQVGRNSVFVKKLVELGCPILFMIHGKGVYETGPNVVWLDNTHAVIGDAGTGNREGLEQFTYVLNNLGIEVYVAHLSGWLDLYGFPNFGVHHMDMVFAVVDLGLAIIYPPFIDYETIRYLKRMKFRLIQVPPEEYMTYICNLMLIEAGKVIVPSEAKETVKALKREGVECIEVEFPEGTKGFGGFDCVTCKLLRDPGPSLDDF